MDNGLKALQCVVDSEAYHWDRLKNLEKDLIEKGVVPEENKYFTLQQARWSAVNELLAEVERLNWTENPPYIRHRTL